MAAYSDIIATVGGATSNSYITGPDADQFASLQSWESVWLGKTESERTIALLQAAKWLDTVDFGGTRCNPSTDSSALPQMRAWPRSDVSCDGVTATCSFIPQAIIDAQCLIAYNLLVNPEMITGSPGGGSGGGAAGTYVASQELGDLKISYAAYPSGESGSDSCVTCDTPTIIEKLPWLKGILACWADISSGGGRVILRVRS